MPDTEYLADLDADRELEDRVRVRIRTQRGRVVDFVAQYEAMIFGCFYPVVRYDGSHGIGHRDLLDARGETIRKEWLSKEMSLAQALNAGLADIDENWRRYRAEFIAREGL